MKMKLWLIYCILLSVTCIIKAEKCVDAKREGSSGLCKQWSEAGLCQTQRKQMMRFCMKTCGFCTECGKVKVKVPRIMHGQTAVRGSWPWQILLFDAGQPMCGGTLVSPRYVVTAAHCIYGKEDSGTFVVRVGEHDREVVEGSEVDIKVLQVYRYPAHSPRFLKNDLAILYLERPVKFNKYVQPACLPSREVPVGTKCYVTGFGKTRLSGGMTRTLQQALLPVVSAQTCYELSSQRLPSTPISDDMICGGSGGASLEATCHGDSGGPYVCKVDGAWELHGSVSFGSPFCSARDMYTTFARTMYFKDWIKKIINNR